MSISPCFSYPDANSTICGHGANLEIGACGASLGICGGANSIMGGIPIRNILLPHVGQTPWVAGVLFFIVMLLGSFISFLVRHFTQYASICVPPELSVTLSTSEYRTSIT